MPFDVKTTKWYEYVITLFELVTTVWHPRISCGIVQYNGIIKPYKQALCNGIDESIIPKINVLLTRYWTRLHMNSIWTLFLKISAYRTKPATIIQLPRTLVPRLNAIAPWSFAVAAVVVFLTSQLPTIASVFLLSTHHKCLPFIYVQFHVCFLMCFLQCIFMFFMLTLFTFSFP